MHLADFIQSDLHFVKYELVLGKSPLEQLRVVTNLRVQWWWHPDSFPELLTKIAENWLAFFLPDVPARQTGMLQWKCKVCDCEFFTPPQ